MQGLREHWHEIVLCGLFVYMWGVRGFAWWVALVCIGWSISRIMED